MKLKTFLGVVLMCLMARFSNAATNTIRFATVVPEGTSWLREINQLAQDIKTKTNNEVEFKIYSSAKMGDETDVIRKMATGVVHAGAFTGVGLGTVQPAIRVLEIPFLFQDKVEEDLVYDKMFPVFEKLFDQKGMVLLSSDEIGDVYVFSKTPIRKRDDFQGVKMWAWEGDPVANNFFKIANLTPVPLPITEVITGLQTGMVNGVYTPPAGLIGFQWWPKVSYMTSPALLGATGAILMTKEKWKTLTPVQQKTVRECVRSAGLRLRKVAREDNASAIETLKKNNIQVVEMDASGRAEFDRVSQELRKNLTGKLYDAAVLKQVETLIKDYRAGKKK